MAHAFFNPSRVLGTAETRRDLPSILSRCRAQGVNAAPVFVGANRKPEAVILPVELVERLAPYLEDLLVAERIRARLNANDATVPAAQVAHELGLRSEDIESAKRDLRREHGLS
jgi:antitoxin StbD